MQYTQYAIWFLTVYFLHSSKYTDLLMRVSKTQQMSFPNVVVFELSKVCKLLESWADLIKNIFMMQHKVYQFPVKEGQSAQEFGESLESFLAGISSGETTAFGMQWIYSIHHIADAGLCGSHLEIIWVVIMSALTCAIALHYVCNQGIVHISLCLVYVRLIISVQL